jgi:histidinol-phosphate aminotransferase
MLAAVTPRTRVMMLCNPNNPTGTSFGAADFERFAAALPDDLILVLDEAYFEFVRRTDFPDSVARLRHRPGTIVLRTFSKIFGLAGLRIGYGIADAEFASYLERARHPFNVNRLAEVAALAAMDDSEHVRRTRELNASGIEYLASELGKLGIETWPSDANFLLAKPGADVFDPLLQKGVIVRPMGGFGLTEHVRVSIGTPEENERFIKALTEVLEAGATP